MPVSVERKPNESEEQFLRRFRKRVQRSQMMSELRRRRWHVSKGELRRIQKKKAVRRARRRQRHRRG